MGVGKKTAIQSGLSTRSTKNPCRSKKAEVVFSTRWWQTAFLKDFFTF